MGDLPARLSDQQQFILAVIADETADVDEENLPESKLFRAVRRQIEGRGYPVHRLSWEVAEEFDTDGDRIVDRKAAREELLGDEASALLLGVIYAELDDRALTEQHSASFSRCLHRLNERDLLVRTVTTDGGSQTRWGEPTEEGQEVGREVRRRHGDGRYSLQFDTEPWRGDSA